MAQKLTSFLKGVREYAYPVLDKSAFMERCVPPPLGLGSPLRHVLAMLPSLPCLMVPSFLVSSSNLLILNPQGSVDPSRVRAGGRSACVPVSHLVVGRGGPDQKEALPASG